MVLEWAIKLKNRVINQGRMFSTDIQPCGSSQIVKWGPLEHKSLKSVFSGTPCTFLVCFIYVLLFKLDPQGSCRQPSQPRGGELEGRRAGGKHHGRDQPQGGNPQECQHAELRSENGCVGECWALIKTLYVILSIQPTSLLEMQLIATDRHKTNNYQTLEHNHFPRRACLNHSNCIVG